MPRDRAIIFDNLIGQARRAPDCGRCGYSSFTRFRGANAPNPTGVANGNA
jgi:hypothetical protein